MDRKRDHYIYPNTETGPSSISFSLDSARSEEGGTGTLGATGRRN